MTYRTFAAPGVLLLALSVIACGKDSVATPSVPTSQPQPGVPPASSPTLTAVSLSGVVYEVTANGRTPIAGAVVYCEPCGKETHTFATADNNGFYQFSGDLAKGGGVWLAAGVPTPVIVGFYNKEYEDPPGASRQVLIQGDTRFDIDLVRRKANP